MDLNFQNQEENLEKKKKSKKFLISALAILLICFISVLASRIWDPLWNPFRPEPEKVIEKMSVRLEKVKSFSQKMEISVSGRNGGEIEFRLVAEGKGDFSQAENPKFDLKFDSFLSSILKETQGGIKFAIGGQLRSLDEKTYIKFDNLPAVQFLEMLGINLPDLIGQWIKIDSESLLALMKELAGEEWTPEMEKMFKESLEKEKTFQKGLQEKIRKIFQLKKFYLIKKELPDEKLDGIRVYHYFFEINQNELLKAVSEILKTFEEEMLKEYAFSPTFGGVEDSLKEFFNKIGKIEGEIWIGKKDYLPYKIRMEKTIEVSQIDPREKGKITIKLTLESSNFDLPVKIETPSQFKDLKEFLLPLLGPLYGKIRESGKDAQLVSLMSHLGGVAELIYTQEDSYQNLCRDSTLNERLPDFGEWLMEIENEIKELQAGTLKLSCSSSIDSYCVIVDLVSPEKGKYCIDSSGFRGEVKETSKCIGKGTEKEPYRCSK